MFNVFLDAMENIKDNEHNNLFGVCSLVRVYFESHYGDEEGCNLFAMWLQWSHDTWVKWELYSGNRTYPVPHPEHRPDHAYGLTYNKWDMDTEYGKNRMKLLEFLISKVKEKLEDNKYTDGEE